MLQTLELANIRSYQNGLFEFSESVNIVVGPNASGKTNLLESIYMSAKGSAFKSSDEQMINRNSEWGRIDSSYSDHTRVVKLQKKSPYKSFLFDDAEYNKFDQDKSIPIVLFEPQHMLLIGGEPDLRRDYIDSLLTQTVSGFSQVLKNYKRTLAQRNRLLKQDKIDPEHLFAWDIRLSDLGGKIIEQRTKYIKFIEEHLTSNYRAVSGNTEDVKIIYESKISLEQYTSNMLKALKSDYPKDKIRGYTSVGPHRDNLRFEINNNDARESASRGETRSIVLALKIAEVKLIEQITTTKPILLLDDVFSELDGKRRRTLSETLQSYQTFITTTDADVAIEHFSKNCNIIPL